VSFDRLTLFILQHEETLNMTIDVKQDQGVLTLTINRPAKKNAFTQEMYSILANEFEQAIDNPAVRVVLIQGQPDIFCAGNDLDAFMNGPIDVEKAPVFRLLRVISKFPKPVVACIRGAAVGIGTTLLMHCDFAYASEKAKFSMPFAALGICPEAASSLLFPMMAGYPRAAEMLLLGDAINAQQAVESRLINAVIADEDIDAHVAKIIARLLAMPMRSLVVTKGFMRSHLAQQVASTLEVEAAQFSAMLAGGEVKEACKAFMEKRKPDFSAFNG
jgi:enoyl-CoA hydratase/carnithine racemase